MPKIKKVLFPVDFSERCFGAARYVEALAGRFEAELLLLHVVEFGDRALIPQLEQTRKHQLDEFLEDELKHYTTKRLCLLGDPAVKIVETVRSWEPDLVMMPTFGVGFYRRMLLGSVTTKILHDVECPVWTDVHAEQAPPLEKIVCSRVLCAVGLDQRSSCVLKWAQFLADEYQAKLSIVHAVPAAVTAGPTYALDQEYASYLAQDAAKRIEDLQQSAGSKAAAIIAAGSPVEVVTKAAHEFGADLLILGRHGRGGPLGHLRQNAYSILRDSPCPAISI